MNHRDEPEVVTALCRCCRPAVVAQARSAIDVLADASVPRPLRQVAGAECIQAVVSLMGPASRREALASPSATDPGWELPV